VKQEESCMLGIIILLDISIMIKGIGTGNKHIWRIENVSEWACSISD
jgi:hypothetical protein